MCQKKNKNAQQALKAQEKELTTGKIEGWIGVKEGGQRIRFRLWMKEWGKRRKQTIL